MRRTARCLPLLVFLSFSAGAEELPLERAKESFKAGATAYAAGDYLAAIQALDAAYELTPLPAIAFSLAQAERRQYFVDREREHLDRAISLFRAYVDRLPSGGRRADALDALSQLEPLAMALGRAEPSRKPKSEDTPRRTRLMVASPSSLARVSLDGGPAVASPLIREVAPGQHRAHVEADGFFAADREVIAVAGELIMTEVPLVERPSTLTLWTRKNAELYVDGAFIGSGGARVTVQLPSGTHRLAVAENGYRVARRTLVLERGETVAVRVPLEPTTRCPALRRGDRKSTRLNSSHTS